MLVGPHAGGLPAPDPGFRRRPAWRKEYLALCAPASLLQPGQSFAIESRFAPFGPGRRKVRVVPAGVAPASRAGPAQGFPGKLPHRGGGGAGPPGLALVRARILRGFRHQVRAHLGHLGLPIVGDELYGARLPPGVDRRLYLHACSVELAHPASGAAMRINSPLPAAFAVCYGSKRGSE